jgi:alcohol dehydrogenase class IV
MEFEFTTVTQIIFGPGKLNSIGSLCNSLGDRVLIITGSPQDITDRLASLLEKSNIKSLIFTVLTEPTLTTVQTAVEFCRKSSINLVIGIGGGSAIDTAKAASSLATNSGDITDYLEVIGLNKPLINHPLPLIAIPTTAGTGSEVTKNAVIEAPEYHIKVSLRSPLLFPKIALVDPELTQGLPPDITAFTGLDALTQLIEPFTCNIPNPMTDALCRAGIMRAAYSLSKAYDDGEDKVARENMALASLFSGIALTNAKLGAVHGLAGPIGGEIPAHHGTICARLLPEVMQANIKALSTLSPTNPALIRFAEAARLLTSNPNATAADAVQWVHHICKYLNIQPLSSFGLVREQFPAIIEKAKSASSMKGNPITLSDAELRNILIESLLPL